MSTPRVQAPSADEIERRFRGAGVTTLRPLLRGGLHALQLARSFSWHAANPEALENVQEPVLMVANHCSHVDTAAILSVLPRAMRNRTCVAAALDVFGPADRSTARPTSVLKRECLQVIVAAGFHAFAFDRNGSSLRSIRTANDMVQRGWNLLLYPEGTRSRDGSMAPFKSGVGVLARKTGAAVLPIHVHGGSQVLPIGRTLPQRGHIVIRFGTPMRPTDDESTSAFVSRVQDAVGALAPHSERQTDPSEAQAARDRAMAAPARP